MFHKSEVFDNKFILQGGYHCRITLFCITRFPNQSHFDLDKQIVAIHKNHTSGNCTNLVEKPTRYGCDIPFDFGGNFPASCVGFFGS